MSDQQQATIDRMARLSVPLLLAIIAYFAATMRSEITARLDKLGDRQMTIELEQGDVRNRMIYHGQRLDGLERRQTDQQIRIDDIEKRIGFERQIYEVNAW